MRSVRVLVCDVDPTVQIRTHHPSTQSLAQGVVVPIPTFVPVSNIMEFPTVFVPLNFETYPVVPETLDEFISFLAIIGH